MSKNILRKALLFMLLSSFLFGQDNFIIGVLAKDGAQKTMKSWNPTAEYLTKELGKKFTVLPLKFDDIEPAVINGKIDFLIANSAIYMSMNKKHGVDAIVTMINSRQGKALNSFGGVLISKKGSGINSLEDIKGKKYSSVHPTSFGGNYMQLKLLADNGINPEKDCKSFTYKNTHNNVILAVFNGVSDVGAIRTDAIERMSKDAQFDVKDFIILNEIKDEFPFVRSTQLYPEWPFAKLKKVDNNIAKQVVTTLKKIKVTDTPAQSAKIVGWSNPLDYKDVAEVLISLGKL
ncbi:MAG: phosphate/phosphite/phosphonate ABC transporter substrate-binding protein [Melioribacteraceae bacterium]|nr:phosphate/phosphite/phosphonate ABC transporter substrate-binding protein [Melioribacteraceae bacterium]